MSEYDKDNEIGCSGSDLRTIYNSTPTEQIFDPCWLPTSSSMNPIKAQDVIKSRPLKRDRSSAPETPTRPAFRIQYSRSPTDIKEELPRANINPFLEAESVGKSGPSLSMYQWFFSPQRSGDSFSFEPYETISENQGKGSSATVRKVRDRMDGCTYCVKMYTGKIEGEKQLRAQLQEVFVLSALPPHPNIIRYYGAWMENRNLCMRAECCVFGSLQSIWARSCEEQSNNLNPGDGSFKTPTMGVRTFSNSSLVPLGVDGFSLCEASLFQILFQITEAIFHMHAHCFAHLDIKPGNILVASVSPLVVKLADFGLSTTFTANFLEGIILGIISLFYKYVRIISYR
jgi:hypothetical protein